DLPPPPASSTAASPWARPPQIAASPRPPPRRRRAIASVPTIRAPDAPTGCPMAMAPPSAFVLSRSAASAAVSSPESLFVETSDTAAKASLISTRSREARGSPARTSAHSAAAAGAPALRAAPGGFPRRDGRRAVDRRELPECLQCRLRPGELVGLEELPARQRHRDDFLGRDSLGQRPRIHPLRAERPGVLLLAADAEFHGDLAGVHGHRRELRVLHPVQRVLQRHGSHACSPPHARRDDERDA